jgi:hypothetical protein
MSVRSLFTFVTLFLMFSGVASAEIVKLSCKFLEGTNSTAFQIIKIKNEKDAFIVLDTKMKKVLDNKNLYLIYNLKWTENSISWGKQSDDKGTEPRSTEVNLNRFTGKLYSKITFQGYRHFIEKYYQCSEAQKKF